jgi:hypothetical protein
LKIKGHKPVSVFDGKILLNYKSRDLEFSGIQGVSKSKDGKFINSKIELMGKYNADKIIFDVLTPEYDLIELEKDKIYQFKMSSEYLNSVQPAIWKVDYLKNIRDTHILSLQSIIGLKSNLNDKISEITKLLMKNTKLGLELGKSTDEIALMKGKNRESEKEIKGLKSSLETSEKARIDYESAVKTLSKALEEAQLNKED